MRLGLGSTVRCADGPVRRLADVVVDAAGKRVTHLVVEPEGRHDAARLVSLDLARENGEGITLRCTAEALEGLEPVRTYAYLPAGERPDAGDEWSVGVEDVLVVPSQAPLDLAEPELDPNVNVLFDRVPRGEVELRLSSSVYSADEHHVGTVHAVEVGEHGEIRSLALLRGHLWWKREIDVPADVLAALETDLVTLGITKRELRAVPSSRAG
jgi:hypothetical protein